MSYKIIIEEAHAAPIQRRNTVSAPDELAAVRALVRRLNARETALKDILIRDPDQRTGVDFDVEVNERGGATAWKAVAEAVVTESFFDVTRFDELCDQLVGRPAVTVTLRPRDDGDAA